MKQIKYLSIGLSIIGIIIIYSASNVWAKFKFDNEYYFLFRQLIFFFLGLITMEVISKVDYLLYKKHANKILLLGFIGLVLVLIPGVGMVRGGARSWIGIGQFSIQPSEIMKLSLAIFTAKVLSSNNFTKFKDFIGLLLVLFLVFTIIMLQPDFGTGVVIIGGVFLVLIIAGLPIRNMILLGMAGFMGLVALIISAPYRMKRIFAFIDPWSDPLGSGFQIIQSMYALVPGGLFGYGLGGSRQKFYYLPEPQTDFIFAILTEELGLIGVILVLTLYFLLFYYIFILSIKCKDMFAKYLVLGIGTTLFVQFTINIAVVIGLMPVTGVTLPFLSYGGSSLVITLASIGILMNISKDVSR